MSATATTAPSSTEVLRFANATHQLAIGADRPDLAQRVADEAELWGQDETTIVVAGDVKRGKSSLVNSLLGTPGLLPVDADVATSVHLTVRHAETRTVEVVRATADGPRSEPIAEHELVDHASEAGDPALRADVTAVEVGHPHPLLARGAVLVDTPGVGGMSRGHRDTTMAALRRADALLFTVAADEPVRRSELEFLAEACERIATVVLVVTRVDAQPNWPAIVAEDQQRLARHAEHLAAAAAADDPTVSTLAATRFAELARQPVLPVSARLADRAAEARERGRDERADQLWERSGLGPLVTALEATVAARETVRLRNVLATIQAVLTRLRAVHADRLAALDDAGHAVEQVRDQQAQLERFRSEAGRWRQRFAADLQRVQVEGGRQLGRELQRTEVAYRRRVEELTTEGDDPVARVAEDLERSVAAVWTHVACAVEEAVTAAVARLVDELELQAVDLALDGLTVPADLYAVGPVDAPTDQGGGFLDHGFPVAREGFMTASMVTSVSGLLGLGMGMPVGLLVGAGVALARGNRMKDQRASAEAKRALGQHLRDVLTSARQEYTGELTVRMVEVRTALTELVEARLDERGRELADHHRELVELARADEQERTRTRREATAGLEELDRRLARSEQLRAQVRDGQGEDR